MRLAILIGAVAAVLVGGLGVAAIVGTLQGDPPLTPPPPTATPGTTPLGLYTPPPTVPPTPSPTPTMPGSPTAPIGTQIGNVAPRLVVPDLAGGEIDTASAAGKPLWINFMATWCPSCRDELPMMERVNLDLGDELEVVLVDVGEPEEVVADFMGDLEIDLPVGLDPTGAAQSAWGAFALPVHFLIDADGVVREVIFGGAPREVFAESLQLIVPEADISLPTEEPGPSEEPTTSP
jgi:cytochrome c biogenesis protein CcmG, thiol:disulfide interchange protein DsbE